MAYTLSQLRALIDATCFPVGASNSDKNNLINKTREAFYFTPPQEGGGSSLWRGLITQQTLPAVTQFADVNGNIFQTVTLTRQLNTLVEARDADGPIDIRNEWTQFGRAGYWGGRLLGDLADGYCGVSDISLSGATLKITTTSNEAGGLTVVFVGTDVNGNYLTETVSIPTVSGSSASTVATFYSVTEVVKSVTAGYLVVNQTTLAVDTFFARYEPSETTPNYRRYQYAFKTNRTTVNVKAKRRFYALSADNDLTEFGTVLAIEHGLRAYQWSLAGEGQVYLAAMVEAIGYLNGEQAAYQSDTAEGFVHMEMATAPGQICNIL